MKRHLTILATLWVAYTFGHIRGWTHREQSNK